MGHDKEKQRQNQSYRYGIFEDVMGGEKQDGREL
jgi:hypothetical protein